MLVYTMTNRYISRHSGGKGYRKDMIVMKKGLLLFLAALTALSMVTACGNKTNSDNKANTSSEATENVKETDGATEEKQSEGLSVEGAEKEVNMNKVEGTKLKDAAPEDSSLEAKGEIANCDITIDDTKIIDYTDTITGEQMKVAVVSFKFKNNNSSPNSFDGLISVDATQGGNNMVPVVVVGVEGVNTNSAMSSVETNKSITVQKTYKLNDETTDINITAYKYGESSGNSISKAFKLN